MSKPASLALVCLLALAGCGEKEASSRGGDGGTGAKPAPTSKAIVGCLRRAGVKTTEDLDAIAKKAEVGALTAGFLNNGATVVIERSERAAERTRKRYEGRIDNPEERVKREGTVVIAYDRAPVGSESQAIEGCL